MLGLAVRCWSSSCDIAVLLLHSMWEEMHSCNAERSWDGLIIWINEVMRLWKFLTSNKKYSLYVMILNSVRICLDYDWSSTHQSLYWSGLFSHSLFRINGKFCLSRKKKHHNAVFQYALFDMHINYIFFLLGFNFGRIMSGVRFVLGSLSVHF